MTKPSPALSSFDPAFLARVRAGDRQAFEMMAEAYYERLVRYAYRYVHDVAVGEDVVQDTLFNIWLTHEQFVVRGSLSSYLFGAVRNRALNYTRHQRVEARWQERMSSREVGDPGTWIDARVTPASDWDEGDEDDTFQTRLAAVRSAIAALPPRQAEAFWLRVEHGMSFAEVAEVMGLSLRSAQTTYLRAVQCLRERLAPYVS
jgi:RNA polymerase sigma-70 factor (ECF subfamily)